MQKPQLLLTAILLICFSGNLRSQTNHTVSGFVKETGSLELLLGVYVFSEDGKHGTLTNNYGFYSISLPEGEHEIFFAYIGYEQHSEKLNLTEDKRLDITLTPETDILKEAVVKAGNKQDESEKIQMSTIDIPIRQIKEIPAIFGEKDVLKVLQLMPGVQSGSEGQSGIYVRGGGPDQNLIVLDGATVYNAQHLFGFFSLFNGDALRSVELIKGGFPARYGGRLSSVIDMNMKDGNKDHITGEVGLGAISSRGVLEGPFAKGKGSFIISGRRTYIDALIQPFVFASTKGSSAGYYFYDLNAKLNYELSENDRIYLSGYFGQDKFYVNETQTSLFVSDKWKSKTNFGWGNATATLRWNHVVNSKLFLNTSLIFSRYNLGIGATQWTNDKVDFDIQYNSGIRDFSLKQDYDWSLSDNHKIRFGFAATHHLFTPDALAIKGEFIDEKIDRATHYKTVETGLYAEDEFRVGTKLRGMAGMRFSSFHVKGRNYFRPEPRVSLNYSIKKGLSAKASYAFMNQYIHLLSNSGVGLPTDLWVPATNRIPPQQSQQVAAGLAKDIPAYRFFITLEGYYKVMNNIIGYKEGASFLSIQGDNPGAEQITWEDNVTTGDGRSCGTELLLQRKEGRLTGWIGYTLSWTTMQFDELNNGKRFYARYDRRHDVSVVAQYKWRPNINISATWVYGTGNAITLPLSEFFIPNIPTGNAFIDQYWSSGREYSDRNGFRMKPYHRADVGIRFEKELKRTYRTFEVSVYNLYNRHNPFFYYTGQVPLSDGSGYKNVLKQISIFPVLPSISWTYKFK
ncbi:MAG: TonB-dependent receptor plug domain-containing protein [Bacteroidetes bacterium]|nr:TonB-dependent receptor plug domain-containing protein [Bacteroidota bacterium]